jgi:colanic acid biosynthesis glycosyl transferase WcaI
MSGSTVLPTLLVISQVYPPDPAALGQHLADVAEEMVRRGWRVIVYTADRGYEDPSVRYARRESRSGVEIRRFRWSSFGKRSIAIRLAAQGLFMTQACVAAAVRGSVSAILASTSPPFAGFGAAVVARLRRVPLTWWVMDLNPDQMIAAGKIGPRSLPARVFDAMNRVALRASRSVIVLDRYMRDRALAKAHVPKKILVSPPWAAVESSGSSDGTTFRREHGLEGRFIVMYSGNHALQHPLTTLLDAADRLRDEPGIVFVFVGGGSGKAEVDARIAAGAKNIRSLPYQPLEQLAGTLAAADVHVVSMGDDMVGIVHPCKIYGVLAAGRPVLYLGPRHSHVGDILSGATVGWHVTHGDVVAAVSAIRSAAELPNDRLQTLGQAARQLAEQSYPRKQLVAAVCQQLETGFKPNRP